MRFCASDDDDVVKADTGALVCAVLVINITDKLCPVDRVVIT